MAETVYLLCAVTSLGCTLLLLKAYTTQKTSLLLWSGICFLFLFLNNLVLFIDLALVTQVDLSLYRNLLILIGVFIFIKELVRGMI